MADDNTIIEGTVKFRDGKKWKSRWCVMRKLSPVADCVHLQLYRDSRARWGAGAGGGGGGCKAALSLQQFLGCEAGFTLDKHSNTLALICTDLVAILAFETRERLIQWQVKVSAHLGEARNYLVLVGGATGAGAPGARARAAAAAGPARLLLHERRFALAAGVPPRLLGVWELAHLRRYGVVEGRFCFEGGSHCGKGEGLHVLITDQAKELANDFDLASRGRLSPRRRPIHSKKNDGAESPKSQKTFRPDTRLSELNTVDRSLPPMELRLHEDIRTGEDAGAISPYWPSIERQYQDMGLGDTASVNETTEGMDSAPWGGGSGKVTLERCMSCMSKLGALSRSSTAALTPGAKHFSPAWTMDALHEACAEAITTNPNAYGASATVVDKTEDVCRCPAPVRPPGRPPKPMRLELNLNNKPPMPLPTQPCTCSCTFDENRSRIGPYENYDVPKLASADIDGEYYDTPKRLKECLNNELFKITKSTSPNAVILKKPCGCLLKFGRRRKEMTVVDVDDSIQPAACPCRRVTDWANSWIKLPYCRKNTVSTDNLAQDKENSKPIAHSALYATIDLSRKTRRKTHPIEPGEFIRLDSKTVEVDEGPLANYENLNFALSLEYYENAKDLLRRAGVTQSELDAISANLIPPDLPAKGDRDRCRRCGQPPAPDNKENTPQTSTTIPGDDYLMMEPKSLDGVGIGETPLASAGYTPMSPIGGFAFPAPRRPARNPDGALRPDEKSASNPTLCADEADGRRPRASGDRADRRTRSSSADSSRFLEDVKEFEGSVGSRGSSSIETLRNLEMSSPAPCRCAGGAGRTGAGDKQSDADSSEASRTGGRGARGPPPPRRACSAPGAAGNRDSSSSNDSGVSSCELRRGGDLPDFELPPTTAAARRHYRTARRAATTRGAELPRRSRSTDPLREAATPAPAKSSSAEAEVPVLSARCLRGIVDTHSTSSGTSDMSDYIETLSICSSHSSTDAPIAMRERACGVREAASTLRPRSGKEYLRVAPRRAAPPHLYSNLP